MVKVKLKKISENKEKELSIIVPNTVIQGIGWVATTSILWKFINNSISYKNTNMEKRVIAPIEFDRESMRKLLKEIKHYKGLTVVDVKSKDGTEVIVKL